MTRLLEREIGQRKPLSLVDQAAANLHRSSAVLLQEVGAYLAGYELSPKQYNILRILRGAGEKGLCCGDIAGRLVTPDPDITRLLDRLAKRKWILRTRGDDLQDRRIVRVRISSLGLRLLASTEKGVQAIQNRQFGYLQPLELRKLIDLLESLREPGLKKKLNHEL